jgi:hypothetical protein
MIGKYVQDAGDGAVRNHNAQNDAGNGNQKDDESY